MDTLRIHKEVHAANKALLQRQAEHDAAVQEQIAATDAVARAALSTATISLQRSEATAREVKEMKLVQIAASAALICAEENQQLAIARAGAAVLEQASRPHSDHIEQAFAYALRCSDELKARVRPHVADFLRLYADATVDADTKLTAASVIARGKDQTEHVIFVTSVDTSRGIYAIRSFEKIGTPGSRVYVFPITVSHSHAMSLVLAEISNFTVESTKKRRLSTVSADESLNFAVDVPVSSEPLRTVRYICPLYQILDA
jgi:hypothetical protein